MTERQQRWQGFGAGARGDCRGVERQQIEAVEGPGKLKPWAYAVMLLMSQFLQTAAVIYLL